MAEFREMRRKDKLLPEAEAYSILENASYMTLSTVLENGYPYAVPLNHVLLDGMIFFHCALEGQKCDAFRRESRVCVNAVESCDVVPDKFTTNYRSAVIFGKISPVDDISLKRAALTAIIRKFSPGFMESGEAYIDRFFEKTAVYCIAIEHITGKMSRK